MTKRVQHVLIPLNSGLGEIHIEKITKALENVLIPLNSGLGEIRRLGRLLQCARRLNPFEFRAWGNTPFSSLSLQPLQS